MTTPVMVVGTILLAVAGASDGVLQALGIMYFVSNFIILRALDSRYERRRRRATRALGTQ